MEQKQLAIIGSIPGGRADVPWDQVAAWPTEQEAYRQCVYRHPARLSQGDIAEMIGMKRGNFTTILNSDGEGSVERGLTRVRQIKLQNACQTNAIDQWAELYERGALNCQKSLEALEAEYEAKLAEVRRQRGVA